MPFINDNSLNPVNPKPLVPDKMEPLHKPAVHAPENEKVEPHHLEEKSGDASIFHGTSDLRKKFAVREIRDVAKEIGKMGYKEKKKYGIKGDKIWEYQKFAKEVVESLPDTISPGSVQPREIKRKIWEQKRELSKDQHAMDAEKVIKDKQRLRFLKKISGE